MSVRTRIIIGLLFCLTSAGAWGQESWLEATKSAGKTPLTAKEIPAGYKPFRMEYPGASGGLGLYAEMAAMFSVALKSVTSSEADDQTLSSAMVASNFVWLAGEKTKLGGFEFYKGYRPRLGLIDYVELMGSPSAPPELLFDLVLIRVDTVSSIRAANSIEAEDIARFYDTSRGIFVKAKEAAKRAATLSNAKQVALGVMIYSGDYDDVMPIAKNEADAKNLVQPYLKNDALWRSNNPNGGELIFALNLAGIDSTQVESPADTPMIYETKSWPDGKRVVAFCDGHAKLVSAEDWEKLKPLLSKVYVKPLPPKLEKQKPKKAVTKKKSGKKGKR